MSEYATYFAWVIGSTLAFTAITISIVKDGLRARAARKRLELLQEIT